MARDWDSADWNQIGYLGVLTRNLPIQQARHAARLFRSGVWADKARTVRWMRARADERHHHEATPGELLDLPDLLARLTPREREIVRLRYWEGLTHAQAAERLGVSEATILRRHTIAMAKMRR